MKKIFFKYDTRKIINSKWKSNCGKKKVLSKSAKLSSIEERRKPVTKVVVLLGSVEKPWICLISNVCQHRERSCHYTGECKEEKETQILEFIILSLKSKIDKEENKENLKMKSENIFLVQFD